MIKRNNKFLVYSVSFVSVLSVSLLCIGEASFFYSTSLEELSKAQNPVCYNGSTYYTKIESALNEAKSGDTIYVIPGDVNTITTIEDDCTIKSGVSLILPYDREEYYETDKNDVSGFGDNDANTYRKSQVRISQGTTLTIESDGNLFIGGMNGGASPQGGTPQSYAEIYMEKDSKINNFGNIKCYGFIKEEIDGLSYIINQPNSSLLQPLCIFDWGSSTTALGKKGAGIFPFQQFDLCNIRPTIRTLYGAKYKALVHIYGRWAGSNLLELDVISNTKDSLIILNSEGSYIDWNYNDKNTQSTSTTNFYNTHSNELYFNGDASIGHLNPTLQGISIDSADFYLPLTAAYDFIIDEGVFDVDYRTEFLPGSSLIVKENATLNINKDALFYPNNTSIDGVAMPGYSINTPANLTNYGIINVDNGATFGGHINTNNVALGSVKVLNSPLIRPTVSKHGTGSDNVHDFTFDGTIDVKNSLDEENIIKNDLILPGNSYIGYDGFWLKDVNEKTIFTSISPTHYESTYENTADSVQIVAKVIAANFDYDESLIQYNWSINQSEGDPKYGELTGDLNSNTVTLNLKPGGRGTLEPNKNVYVTIEPTYSDGTVQVTFLGDHQGQYVAKSECLLPNTLVLTKGNIYKEVKDVSSDDILIAFNHLTGTFVERKIVFNDFEEKQLLTVIKLEFSNGKTVEIISEHGFFDLDLNRYIYITESNFKDFIGHRFISVNVIGGSIQRSETTLVNASSYENYTEVYSPVTEYDLNYITEDVLSMPGGITGLFNIFEYNSDATINKEKMAEDIRRYGLFDYEKDFKNLISKYVFDVFNIQYLKVSLGKGMITEDYMQYLIERYTPLID